MKDGYITERQTELYNCTFVKTILMLIVVLYHSILFWSRTWFVGEPVYSSNILSITAKWMNSFHIYGFTLVSGYLFYFLKYEKGKYANFGPFIINKAKRLLIPYIFVSIVWAIPFSYLFYDISVRDIIYEYAIGISPSQLWFLLMLFGVFIVFWLLSNFFEKHNVLGGLIVLLFYGVGLFGHYVLANYFQIFRACTYLTFFYIGFKIRQFGSQKLRCIPIIIWLIFDIGLFVLYQYVQSYDGFIFTLVGLMIGFLLNIIGAITAFLTLQKIANRVKWHKSRVFSFISKNSMPVYLFHQQIVYVFIYLLNGVINPYLHATINFVGAMIISLAISAIMMKFKWTRFLIGEK